MRFKVIINACSPVFLRRVEEVCAFIDAHKTLFRVNHYTDAEALVFYSQEDVEEQLAEKLPFRKIKLIKLKHYQPEPILYALEELEGQNPADLYIFTGDLAGNELAVRFASRMKSSSLVAVEKLDRQQGNMIGSKKVYSGNLLGSFHFIKKPYCLSLARGMNRIETSLPRQKKNINYFDYSTYNDERVPVQCREISKTEEQCFDKAQFVIAVGRGAGNREAVAHLERISRQLGAELGVSRPVVMNAWAPLNRLIGASGNVIAPDICLALAVSGSPPFYYGIENSKLIIAVNTDKEAPLVKAADLVIIDDYKVIIEELCKLIVKSN